MIHSRPASQPGPKARAVLPTSSAECLRRAELAEACAARVEIEIAQDRLLELAEFWRRRARELRPEPRTFEARDES